MHKPLQPIDYGGPADVEFEAILPSILEQGVYRAFIASAARYADNLAVADLQTRLTYGELQQESLGLAQYLHDVSLASSADGNAPIAIYLPHQVELTVTILACLALGVPYVPLDTLFPLSRNRAILENSAAQAIVTQAQYAEICRDIAPHNCQVIVLDTCDHSEAPSEPQCEKTVRGNAKDIAYILYTSGSTGAPKGVYQNQRGLLHDVMQYVNAAHINATDRLTMLYSGSVIGSIRDLFGALLTGASVWLLSAKELGVSGVLRVIADQKLSILHAVPVLFRQLMQDTDAKAQLRSVRLAYLAGDRLDIEDAQSFQLNFPTHAYLYTGIGSTENSTLYRHWFIAADTPLTYEVLPVGRAIPDRFVRLLDDNGNEVAAGEVGEIEVTSAFMALGYWRNEALSERFFQKSSLILGARRFLTGDLARERRDGLLEFYGRKDSQVKLRGYLVHPGEIERKAKSLRGVGEAAIIVRKDDSGQAIGLVLYWSAQSEHLTEFDLRQYLTEHLTLAQMPARFYRLPQLPLLGNFKIDRQKLSALDSVYQTQSTAQASYDSTMLGRTRRVVHEVMAGGAVSRHDDLNSLHADSLDIMRMVLALEHEFAVTIDAEAFVKNFKSVEALTNFIETLKNEKCDESC
ncbi:MAG: AMP-binding protein [Aliidiomarina sp.]|uniref:AMP-binding protein n=1 Tax=Aliidiomarina sp. TaxID=1872439 RepID=UPI0025C461A2|nr:AMP-binding protein [Aliidiomarina sp.]MCH8502325.1 AMP-binding protein [Aliidiomarina sp.]